MFVGMEAGRPVGRLADNLSERRMNDQLARREWDGKGM